VHALIVVDDNFPAVDRAGDILGMPDRERSATGQLDEEGLERLLRLHEADLLVRRHGRVSSSLKGLAPTYHH
jgi:hypothetical protein